MKRTLWMITAAAAALSGCVGQLGESNEAEEGTPDPSDQPQSCAGPADVAPSPMRRLTRNEYLWTVRDLLGEEGNPAAAFPPDEAVGGFYSNSNVTLGEQELPLYASAAEDAAKRFVADRLPLELTCDLAETSCVGPFLAGLGKRAFRRPLEQAEEQALVGQYEAARAEWGAPLAVQLVIEAMLLSPKFLYHVELGSGSPADGELVTLTPFEVASRLSYFLWQSMPDDDLLAAAEAGDLDSMEGLEAQARRMLADERSRRGIQSFYSQWLQIDGLVDLAKDPVQAPEWSASLARAMRRETMTFVDDLYREGDGRFQTLLTAPYSFVNEELGEVYGIDVTGAEHVRVDLPPERRGGLLTQASFLTSHAHTNMTSWVHRGKHVRDKLLCQTLALPNANVDMSNLNNPDRVNDEYCGTCHKLMDPIGKSFDRFDLTGKFDEDSDPSIGNGEVFNAPEGVEGPYSDPVELAARLADSPTAQRCMSDQWLKYGLRRQTTKVDRCTAQRLADAFEASGQDLRELAVAVVTLEGFRLRRITKPE